MGRNTNFRLNKFIFLQIALLLITLIVAFISLTIGSVSIDYLTTFNILTNNSTEIPLQKIILEIRLPRIIYAILVGGGLSIAGTVFQAILVNPLAEPYILGISSGGTFGAILSLVIGVSFFGTQIFAFIGAISVMFLVFFLGKRYGDLEPNTLLLSGVMIGAFFSALILLMMIFLSNSLRTAIFWMIGSLSFAKLENLEFFSVTVIIIFIYLSFNSYKYNLLTMGNQTTNSLGIDAKKLKNITYFTISVLIGIIVSVSGIIGFVGLIVPHICRIVWGMDNRIIIPTSFFIGAIYLTIADTFARTIISPAELPVGAVTAIIGVPIFIYLLRTRFNLT